MKVALLTGTERRHRALGSLLALHFHTSVVYDTNVKPVSDGGSAIIARHLADRERAEQKEFSGAIYNFVPQKEYHSCGLDNETVYALCDSADVVVSYGCGIIREPLLGIVSHKSVNIHLGLSPYYRGAGTLIHAMADGALECVGVTFHRLDAGIDTGPIYHQTRTYKVAGTSYHEMGYNEISNAFLTMARSLAWVVDDGFSLGARPTYPDFSERVCRRKDFGEHTVLSLEQNFERNLLAYLEEEKIRMKQRPIVKGWR